MNGVKRLLLVLALCAGLGCEHRQQGEKKPVPVATKPAHANEADLSTVVLTPQQVERLGVKTAVVELRRLPEAELLPGDVAIPDGKTIAITAPLAGTLSPAPQTERVASGCPVKAGQVLFLLTPVFGGRSESLSPADRINLAKARADLAAAEAESEGQLRSARAQHDAASAKVKRADQLVSSNAGSLKSLEEARAELAIAEALMQAAERRLTVLRKSIGDAAAGSVSALPIEAPIDAVVAAVHVSPTQQVTAGTRLVDLARLDPLWVRAHVYAGAYGRINTEADAQVRPIGGQLVSSRNSAQAKPVPSFPSADPLATTIDLIYEVSNADASFRPGQRVGILVPLKAEAERLVIPWSAVIHDVHGGVWVYEMKAQGTFVRRRIEVARVADDSAVLARGLKAGDVVVSVAAAELFGTEFGVGK